MFTQFKALAVLVLLGAVAPNAGAESVTVSAGAKITTTASNDSSSVAGGISMETAKKLVYGFSSSIDKTTKTANLKGSIPRECVENFKLETDSRVDSDGWVRFALIDTSGEGVRCLETAKDKCPGDTCVSFESLSTDQKTMTKFRSSAPLLDSEISRARVGLVAVLAKETPKAGPGGGPPGERTMEGMTPCADCKGPVARTGLNRNSETVSKLRDGVASRDRDEEEDDDSSPRKKRRTKVSRSRDLDDDSDDDDDDVLDAAAKRKERRRSQTVLANAERMGLINSSQIQQQQQQLQQQQMQMSQQMSMMSQGGISSANPNTSMYASNPYSSMMGNLSTMGMSSGGLSPYSQGGIAAQSYGGIVTNPYQSMYSSNPYASMMGGSIGGLSSFGSSPYASNPFASLMGGMSYGGIPATSTGGISSLYGSSPYASLFSGGGYYGGSSLFGGSAFRNSFSSPFGSSYSGLLGSSSGGILVGR